MGTVLSIIQSAATRLNLSKQIASVIGNQDQDVKGLLEAFTAEGKDLLTEDPPWATLIKEHHFDTADQVEEYPLPPDYQRMLNNTVWDRNQYWQIRGGITPQQWQVIRSGLYQTARLSSNFRIKQASAGTTKAFYLDPVPGSIRPLVFEYQSNFWLHPDGASTFSTDPVNDTDMPIFDDELMIQGVRWRWRQARDLPYAALMADYKSYRDNIIAQDRSPPTLSINEQPWVLPIGNVPDTGYGLV